MKYPYSKQEGGIILGLMLTIWGIGARFEGANTLSSILLVVGLCLLLPLVYLRYFKK